MTEKQENQATKKRGYARTFKTMEAYEEWARNNDDEATISQETPEERFWQLADLSDSVAALKPRERRHFGLTFKTFDEYKAWRNEQETGRDRGQMDRGLQAAEQLQR